MRYIKDSLLAYGTPIPLLFLAGIRVYPFLVNHEDCSYIGSTYDFLMLAKELQGYDELFTMCLNEQGVSDESDIPADQHLPLPW